MKEGGVGTEAMLAAPTEMILSRFLHLARRIISPLVSGIIVTLIGLPLTQLGLLSIGGGFGAMQDGSLPAMALPIPMQYGLGFDASLFNTFPVFIFSQNNGVIQMTGVASRHVGFFVAAILVLMACSLPSVP
ncbi:hypothetical protein GCM10022394_28500 [Zobellella aerophila]|uniref:PTS EIIC type-1 domain-containing protein n=1 Tax=Zobellella aerophila TaxID=870480 RepID=A0ABP6WA15_9GAMM